MRRAPRLGRRWALREAGGVGPCGCWGRRGLVTVPLFYASGRAHLGHLYSGLVGDAARRWAVMRGQPGGLVAGMDEHGAKVVAAAAARGLSPARLTEELAQDLDALFRTFDVRPSALVRTSSPVHRANVEAFWRRLEAGGAIGRGRHEGWYSLADEAFCTEAQTEVRDAGDGSQRRVSLESGRPVHWVQEDNYVFRLQPYKARIVDWLSRPGVVWPKEQVPNLIHWLEGRPDPSVSREQSRAGGWGVEVPGDPSQLIYVWLDALVGYLTGAGWRGEAETPEGFPPQLQVLGKDIATFHGVHWPAFLLAAGFPLPPRLYVHSHWLADGEKMSKSLGNVVEPMREAAALGPSGAEALRYFVARHPVAHKDSSYARDKVRQVANHELGNVWGNLASRCLGPALNAEGRLAGWCPVGYAAAVELADGLDLAERAAAAVSQVSGHYDRLELCRAADLVAGLGREAGRFLERTRPWALAPSDARRPAALRAVLDTARLAALLLQPLAPAFAQRLLSALAVSPHHRLLRHATPDLNPQPRPLPLLHSPLFPRLKAPP